MVTNESKKVIDDWMVFVDDHVDNMKTSKVEIRSAMEKLDDNELNKVATGLTDSKTKMEEAQQILDGLWAFVQK